MSKKTNSLVFMLVATLLNLVLLVIFFIIGMVLISLFANAYPDSSMIPVLMVVVFLAAIAGSFLIYSKIVKWANKKYSLEDKLDPIFGGKNRRPPRRSEE